MSLSNVISSEAKQRMQAEAASKTQHLDRFNRCKQKFNRLSREDIVRWLNTLEPQERERCKIVLNGLLKRRQMEKAK